MFCKRANTHKSTESLRMPNRLPLLPAGHIDGDAKRCRSAHVRTSHTYIHRNAVRVCYYLDFGQFPLREMSLVCVPSILLYFHLICTPIHIHIYNITKFFTYKNTVGLVINHFFLEKASPFDAKKKLWIYIMLKLAGKRWTSEKTLFLSTWTQSYNVLTHAHAHAHIN